MTSAKQNHKSKEEILAEMEEKKVSEIRMKFINEHFMPLMENITNNLEEAQFLADTVKQSIIQAFQMRSKEMKVIELGLEAMFNKAKNPELLQKHIKIVDILKDQTVDDGLRLCDGLFQAINEQISKEMKAKKLSDFKKDDKV
jgi:hypothetical protein